MMITHLRDPRSSVAAASRLSDVSRTEFNAQNKVIKRLVFIIIPRQCRSGETGKAMRARLTRLTHDAPVTRNHATPQSTETLYKHRVKTSTTQTHLKDPHSLLENVFLNH